MAASLLALILGILWAIKFRHVVGQMLDSWFTISPDHLNVIAFAVAFLLVVIIVHTVAFFCRQTDKSNCPEFLKPPSGGPVWLDCHDFRIKHVAMAD